MRFANRCLSQLALLLVTVTVSERRRGSLFTNARRTSGGGCADDWARRGQTAGRVRGREARDKTRQYLQWTGGHRQESVSADDQE
ncbi:hypothetical protein L596_004003 [Steinernema carpocapsae]|uniref:Secreted protein n=1 Tax=Steinernema carpocapsae TaxID=34508 RepID=A0A4U8UVZ3_STECR|nr:hypothetical protein L596_004003 [Steinernema carpocapsae]